MTNKKLPILISCLLSAAFLSACVSSKDSSESPSSQGEENGLEIVKAMVADIRNLPTTVVEPFSDQADQISQTFQGESGASLMAIAEAAEAINGAVNAYNGFNNLRTYSHVDNNVQVSIDVSGQAPKYTVEQNVMVDGRMVAVSLVALGSYSQASTEEGIEAAEESLDIDYTLSGSSDADDSLLVINSGKLLLTDYEAARESGEIITDGSDGETTYTDVDNDDVSFDSFEISMNATLSEKGSDAASFTGEIGLAMQNLNSQTSSTDTYINGNDRYDWAYEYSNVLGFQSAEFKLAGDFTTADSTQMSASFTLTVEPGDFIQSCEGVESYSEQDGDKSIELCSEETEDSYVDMSFSVSIALDQTGALPDVSVMLSGERTGLEDADLTAQIISGSTILDMEFSYDEQEVVSLVMTNQESVIATMQYAQQDEASDAVLTGSINYQGVEYATISDELGFVEVSYINGQNESF